MSGLPLGVGGPAASAAQGGGGAAADRAGHLVGGLDHVEVVDDHGGVRRGGADRGAVAGGRVDGDVADLSAPLQWGGGQRGQHVAGGAALDLSGQAVDSEGVDEAGVPLVRDRLPAPGVRVLPPLRAPATGLVDAQHLDRLQRRRRHLQAGGAEGIHRGPGQMQVAGGLDDRGPGVAHPPSGRTP